MEVHRVDSLLLFTFLALRAVYLSYVRVIRQFSDILKDINIKEVALKERSIDRYYCRYYRRYLRFLTLSYIKDSLDDRSYALSVQC